MPTAPPFPNSIGSDSDCEPEFSAPKPAPAYPAVPVQYLLNKNAQLINRIKLCYGAEKQAFEAEVLSLIRAYAAFVHMLPASQTQGFTDPGGLLRLGLEVGFFALQGTDARIFSGRSTISVRRELEPRWRLATFIAGLCCELHLAMGRLQVTDSSAEVWPACLHPLAEWLHLRQAHHYTINWNGEFAQARGFGLFALPHVVPASVLQDLASGNSLIVPQLLASISGMPLPQPRNVLDELVRRSLALVIERNLLPQARSADPSSIHLAIGLHLKRFVLDAMRHLIGFNANWAPNLEKSRVRLASDGLFLVWPQAGYDIIKLWEQDQMAGLPKTPAALLEVLAALGLCDTEPSSGDAINRQERDGVTGSDESQSDPHRTAPCPAPSTATQLSAQLHDIHPPGSKVPCRAIRILFPDVILAALQPPPVALEQPMRLPAPTAEPATPNVGSDSTTAAPNELPRPDLKPAPAGTSHRQPPPLSSQPPTQLHLLPDGPALLGKGLEPPAPSESKAPTASLPEESAWAPPAEHSPATNPVPPPSFTLQASLRLNRALTDLLSELLGSWQTGTATECAARPEGLFVPLHLFESHGFPVPVALRALIDARMLVVPVSGEPPLMTLDHKGESTRGVVISARFIKGWPTVPDRPGNAPTRTAGS